MFEFLEFDIFLIGKVNVMKILFWIVYRYLLCVLQVIIKIVINIEYIKIIEFVEVEKFVGSEFVLGVNLFEGLGKQGLIEY